MAYYFVAKTTEADFIGQLTLEEIARRFRAGELSGNYVATKSVGPSYRQLMKSGTAAWITVADLVASPSTPPYPFTPPAVQNTDMSSLVTRMSSKSPQDSLDVRSPTMNGQTRVHTLRQRGTILLMLGVLVLLVPLAFLEGYNRSLGFLGSLPRLTIVLAQGNCYSYPTYTCFGRSTLPYSAAFAGGLISIAVGIVLLVSAAPGVRRTPDRQETAPAQSDKS